MRDANTAACVLKREPAAIRGSGGDGVQGGPAGSLRGRTSAVTLANLLNMHCHSMSSRSGQPRARLAACQTHLAPLPVHAPWDLPAPTGHRPWGLPASFDRPRAQAAGASARVVSTPCVCAVGTRTDGRALWGRPLRGGTPCHRKWPRPQTDGLKAQIERPRIIKLPQN